MIPRCPNWSFALVLLKRRRRYKCAKCGRIYYQKEIDDKEFREYNTRQRERDKDEFERQKLLRRKTLKYRKKSDNPQKQKKLREYSLRHYYKHRDRLLIQKKEYRRKNKAKLNEYRQRYRKTDPNLTQVMSRIWYWRRMQKQVVLIGIGIYALVWI